MTQTITAIQSTLNTDTVNQSERLTDLTVLESGHRRDRMLLAACLTLVAINGVAISVLPHVVRYLASGDSVYVADPDDLIYVANGARAFSGEAFGNTDLPTGHPPGLLPFVGTVPFLHLAGLFSERPLSVLLLWRFWAGLSMAVGVFLLMKSYFQSVWPAVLSALLLPCDAGWLMGRPGVQNVLMGLEFWAHPQATIARGSEVHWQLRIVSPATLMVWLLLYFCLLEQARKTERPMWIVLAGLSLGLLCDAYFFFATTAALGLVLLLVFDGRHRLTYIKVGLLSSLVALPIVYNIWLAREAMIPEAINRLGIAADLSAGVELPRMALLGLLVGGITTFWKRRELTPLWCFALAGLCLYNSHLLTGIDFQHTHWRAYALMPIVSLLLLITGFDVVMNLKPQWLMRTGITFAVLLSVTAGYYLRVEAAVRPKGSTRSDRAVDVRETADSIPRWATVAGPATYVTYAAVSQPIIPLYDSIVFHSSFISEAELSERRALNEFLMGTDPEGYQALIATHLDTYPFGDAAENQEARQELMQTYLSAYDQVIHDHAAVMRKYDVRFLALPEGEHPPELITSVCTLLKTSGPWTIFEIDIDALQSSESSSSEQP